MNPKIWLAIAGAAILGLTFWTGQLHERSINAPAVARAQAQYDALSGEKKTLDQELVKSSSESSRLQLALNQSESRRRALQSQVQTHQKLLGLDGQGHAIIGTDTSSRTKIDENIQARRQMALKARSTRKLASSKKSQLKASRASNPWRHAGVSFTPDDVLSTAGLLKGSLGLEVGVNFGPWTAKIFQPKVIPWKPEPGIGLDLNF